MASAASGFGGVGDGFVDEGLLGVVDPSVVVVAGFPGEISSPPSAPSPVSVLLGDS